MKPQLEALNNLASKVKTPRYSKRELIVRLQFGQSSSISSTLGLVSCQTLPNCCETVLFPNSSNYVHMCHFTLQNMAGGAATSGGASRRESHSAQVSSIVSTELSDFSFRSEPHRILGVFQRFGESYSYHFHG